MSFADWRIFSALNVMLESSFIRPLRATSSPKKKVFTREKFIRNGTPALSTVIASKSVSPSADIISAPPVDVCSDPDTSFCTRNVTLNLY